MKLKVAIVVIFLFLLSFFAFLKWQGVTSKPDGLDAMPKIADSKNIYAKANAGMFSQEVLAALPRVYVPNSLDSTVSVIDPLTYKVLTTFRTDKLPQHIVPSYDLKTLWILNNQGNTVTPIDPKTAKPGSSIPVEDPYNLYFTPDGRFAIVVAEKFKRLEFRDPHTMKLLESIPVQCGGVNHMDFTADGRYAIATCEFTGQLLKLDVANHKVMGYLTLKKDGSSKKGMPQDIRSTADGKTFYVADMVNNGVFLIDPISFRQIGFIPTSMGTHSVYPSRDGQLLYVGNRGCTKMICKPKGPGCVTVIDPVTKRILATWKVPGGGSPDMGNVSADGKELWLSGRYDSEVYVFDTKTGELLHRIKVGRGPHGLTVWPQPGRYSLGHTGNMR